MRWPSSSEAVVLDMAAVMDEMGGVAGMWRVVFDVAIHGGGKVLMPSV